MLGRLPRLIPRSSGTFRRLASTSRTAAPPHQAASTSGSSSSSSPSTTGMPAADEPHTAAGQREKVLPLPLTAPPPQEDDRSRGDGVTTLRVGESLRLDALGPLVVNTDGSVARVGNWAGMTDGEQKATLRLLGKRNQQRLAALKAKLAAEEAAGENEGGSRKP